MPRLRTHLPPDECVRRLREQVQVRIPFLRLKPFRPATSKVIGRVSDDSFSIESSVDVFSKRFHGRLVPDNGGTVIEFTWKNAYFPGRIFSHPSYDEFVIFSFLKEWLETGEVEAG